MIPDPGGGNQPDSTKKKTSSNRGSNFHTNNPADISNVSPRKTQSGSASPLSDHDVIKDILNGENVDNSHTANGATKIVNNSKKVLQQNSPIYKYSKQMKPPAMARGTTSNNSRTVHSNTDEVQKQSSSQTSKQRPNVPLPKHMNKNLTGMAKTQNQTNITDTNNSYLNSHFYNRLIRNK